MMSSKEFPHSAKPPRQNKNLRKVIKMQKIKLKRKDEKTVRELTPTTGSRNSNDFSKKKKLSRKSYLKKNNLTSIPTSTQTQAQILKLRFKEQHDCFPQNDDEGISFREYCAVEGKWVPLLSNTQRERLVDLPSRTEEKRKGQEQKDQNMETIDSLNCSSKLDRIFNQLESCYVSEEYQFCLLSQQNRESYLSLLSGMIKKLKYKQESEAVTPTKSLRQQQQSQTSPIKQFTETTLPQPENDLAQIIETLIKEREAKQLTVGSPDDEEDQFIKGFFTILKFISKLFMVINEGENMEIILNNMRTADGVSKLRKLSIIMGGYQQQPPEEVIPDYILDLVEENGSKGNWNQIFCRCVFDALNDQLAKLRPYYETAGETFPWNFRLPVPITFYQITEDTFELAMMEGRNKILSLASNLCGLQVGEIEEGTIEWEFLIDYRNKKELMCLKKDIDSGMISEKEDIHIQNISTAILIRLSQQLLSGLCCELGDIFLRE